jgi:hypothetical protein
VPPLSFVGVPEIVAVPSPLSKKLTPLGSVEGVHVPAPKAALVSAGGG